MVAEFETVNKIKWYQKWWGKILLIILLLFIIASGVFVYYFYKTFISIYNGQAKYGQDEPPYSMEEIVNPSDPVLGSSSAPITIVEFGDFLCPVCQRNYSVIRELEVKYPDKVQVYWRNLPIIDELSIDLAEAAECAHLQGKFWPYHDRLFQLQEDISFEDLLPIALQIGLDEFHFNQCLREQRNRQKILDDYSLAEELEAVGTPTFFVNGYKLTGFVPLSVWEEIINSIE